MYDDLRMGLSDTMKGIAYGYIKIRHDADRRPYLLYKRKRYNWPDEVQSCCELLWWITWDIMWEHVTKKKATGNMI